MYLDLVTEDFTVPNFLENAEFDSSTTNPLSSVDTASNESCPTNSLPTVPPTKNSSPMPQESNIEQVGVRQNVRTVEEEIAILPVPCKSNEIPVIDLDDDPVVLSDAKCVYFYS